MITDPNTALAPYGPLDEWLRDRLPGPGPLTIERVTTGHSNELFRVDRGAEAWMLRRPPRVPNAPTAHDMVREHRVLEALEGTGVPHATPHGICTDTDLIGVPFYVMEVVDGVAVYEGLPPALEAHREGVAHAAVDALAALHSVDWRAAGLEGLGRPEGYTERQATRWSKQLRSYAFRDIPELEEVATWLADTCPGTSGSALIHGDYGLHNLLFGRDAPARILAIVDWETATIGDPLADLGYFLADWIEPHEVDTWGALGLPYDVTGFPSRAELAARYAAATGCEVTPQTLAWYRALGQFKIAVILEGSYGRYVRGESSDEFFATLEERVPLLARHALAISRGEA